jgi:hypothetical protein
MSPSQWQLSGSCLPLLCSLVHTLRMSQFKEDPKIQVCNKSENARYYSTNHNISTIWLGRTAFRDIVFATGGTVCSNGFASKATNKTQQKPIEIESSSVYKNWRI